MSVPNHTQQGYVPPATVVRAQATRLIEKQQEIQRNNPPSSAAWQAASSEIKRLVREYLGQEPKDAWGR